MIRSKCCYHLTFVQSVLDHLTDDPPTRCSFRKWLCWLITWSSTFHFIWDQSSYLCDRRPFLQKVKQTNELCLFLTEIDWEDYVILWIHWLFNWSFVTSSGDNAGSTSNLRWVRQTQRCLPVRGGLFPLTEVFLLLRACFLWLLGVSASAAGGIGGLLGV